MAMSLPGPHGRSVLYAADVQMSLLITLAHLYFITNSCRVVTDICLSFAMNLLSRAEKAKFGRECYSM